MDAPSIISCIGLTHLGLSLPPFSLKSGEILLIDLQSGGHYHRVQQWLAQRLSGDIPTDGIQVFQKIPFVQHFEETSWLRAVLPMQVRRYLQKYGNPENSLSQRVNENEAITPATPVRSLDNLQRRILELSAAMSKFPGILFDLDGLGPEQAGVALGIVKAWTRQGGTAILLDWSSEFSDYCDASISVEYDSIQAMLT